MDSIIQTTPHRRTTCIDRLLVSLMILVSSIFVFTLLYRCHFGIDLTDEGFYLNWIATPWNYKISHTQFGYIYHPLYQLVGESIVRLRQADMLIMLGLSWGVCIQLFRYVFKDTPTQHALHSFIFYGLTFCLATCVYSFFGAWWWIPTPSYNSLTLEGLLISVIGLLTLSTNKTQPTGYAILGLGWWLTFMAKPTSAVVIGLLSFIYITTTQFKTLTRQQISTPFLVSLGLLCLSAYLIDGSILTFTQRLQLGAESMSLLYAGHIFEFWSNWGFLNDSFLQSTFIILTIFSFLVISISTPIHTKTQMVCFMTLLLLSGIICMHYYKTPIIPTPATNMLALSIPLGACLAFMLLPRVKTHNAPALIILPLIFALLPYAFAIGTRGNLWTTALRMTFFWLLAAIPFMRRLSTTEVIHTRALMALIVAGQLITMILVQLCIEYPYRQSQSLFTQTQSFEIVNRQGRITSHLIIADDDARYMAQLKQTARSNGFNYADAMIDLTGAFPTALYLLGANPIGAPWYIAGFAGSTEYTVFTLSQTPCHELAKAWVLTSLNGTEKYHPHVLAAHGLNHEAYETINDIVYARFNLQHQFIKPKNDYATKVAMCETMRIKQKNAQEIVKKMLENQLPLAQNISALSSAYLNKRQFNHAETLLKNAILVNPAEPVFYSNLCVAYGMQKKYELAIGTCSQALEIDPNFQLAKNNLAWVSTEKDSQNRIQ